MENNEIALSLQNVCFSYKNSDTVTLQNINLDVKKGAFSTLLGPSGCGKTTLLRIISGFLEPESGNVLLNGQNQKGIEPDKRKIGMVFQDYALFPHMTVSQNILYGLKINHKIKHTKQELDEKLNEIAVNLDLKKLLGRYPNELSGGQQQRVALARALILKPEVLLMDEPLSSLDTKLRELVREELKEIQQRLNITTIYVTHAQEEALSLSDEIVVLNEGHILQTGTPRDVYFKPANKFAAGFVGSANFIKQNNQEYLVRPEWFELNKNEKAGEINGTVISSFFLGDKTRFKISTDENQIIVADLPTLDTNYLEKDGLVSLNIQHKWKM